jgi:predicted dehydrogenase
VALDAMAHGCHVLCEKPLSITLDSAGRMVDTAQRSGVVFTMASKFRYVDDIVRARALVSEGVIGDLILFENAFASRVPMHGRWNSDPAISGGGVLIDNGTHSVDIMRYLVGQIEVVKVVPGRRVQKLDVEDTVHLFALTADRVMGNIDLSWSIDKPGESYVRLYGTEGAIEIGWKSSSYKCSNDSEWKKFGNGYDKNAAFGAQIGAFSAACLGQGNLRVSLTDALASVEVINAAYRAMHGSHWTPVRVHESLREFVA